MDLGASRDHAGLVSDVVHGSLTGTTAVNRRIVESWTRCLRDHALDPEHQPDPVVVDRADLKQRQERFCDLSQIARTEMTNLYQQVAGSGYAILLTDNEGVVLNYVGDPMFTGTAAQA